ncbi:MAG: phosphoribosylamine--glycine ligase [Bacteroidetes bacterium]|nr:MAG: phosphoribosylamine--glycine ligase [Bacteroidota bacterium]
MNILLLGSGGREHALAWKIEQSPLCSRLFIAPGNAGTQLCGTNVQLNINDFDAVAGFVVENNIHMVVVGPEDPLVNGITDFLKQKPETKNVLIIGPGKIGAQLEGSKEFAKEFMKKYDIPTAAYRSFTTETYEEGVDFLETLKPPYVLKADGLAAGKGVVIVNSLDGAIDTLKQMLKNKAFGKASEKVVIEEFLDGIEISVFVATDGKNWVLLPEAKDYKRIGEGDTGPNTGGMGAVSPVPFADTEFIEKVKSGIIQPTMDGLMKENIDYKGFIFFGLMNVNGDPFVIEYNVRMGDPEAEVVIPRINSDLVNMMQHMALGTLNEYVIELCPQFAVTVMLVSGGYPESYEKGFEISGLDSPHDSLLFYAGAKEKDGKTITSGGRVIAVTSLHNDMRKAIEMSLSITHKIDFAHKFFRTDIGKDLLK